MDLEVAGRECFGHLDADIPASDRSLTGLEEVTGWPSIGLFDGTLLAGTGDEVP